MVTRRDMIGLAVAGIAGTALDSSGAITRSALALRGAMIGGGKKLPYDYAVEYLESTGTQFVNSGLRFNDTTRLKFKMTSSNNAFNGFFGANASSNEIMLGGRATIDVNYFRGRFTYAFSFDTEYDIEMLFGDPSTLLVNGDVVRSYSGNAASDRIIFLHGFDNLGNLTCSPLKQKFYSLKAWNGDELIKDLIPCVATIEGVQKACYYDAVSKEFVENSGTGSFIAGPRI